MRFSINILRKKKHTHNFFVLIKLKFYTINWSCLKNVEMRIFFSNVTSIFVFVCRIQLFSSLSFVSYCPFIFFNANFYDIHNNINVSLHCSLCEIENVIWFWKSFNKGTHVLYFLPLATLNRSCEVANVY